MSFYHSLTFYWSRKNCVLPLIGTDCVVVPPADEGVPAARLHDAEAPSDELVYNW